MISPLQKKLTAIALCTVLLLIPRYAKAQSPVSAGQAAGIFAAIAAIGAGIAIGIVLAVRHHPSITGCAAANGDSVTLLSDGDRQVYALSGDIASIKAGDRFRISGKKRADRAGNHAFEVLKVGKDYGPCHATP